MAVSKVRTSTILAAVLLTLLPILVFAEDEDDLSSHPGYFPLEDLGIVDPEELTLEVNLHASMLRLVAAATRRADPDFSDLLEGLASVRVRIAPLEKMKPDEVRANIETARRWLKDRGWQTIVRTRDDDEQIHIYLRETEGQIIGLAALAIDESSEATAINIVGPIDLAKLGSLAQKFDIPLLDAVSEEPRGDRDKTERSDSDEESQP